MVDDRYRTTVGRLIWRIATAVVLALFLLPVLVFLTKEYMVQEILIVTLVVAISVAALLVLMIVFVLFQEGTRRAILSTKNGLLRLVKLIHPQVNPPDPIIPRPLHR